MTTKRAQLSFEFLICRFVTQRRHPCCEAKVTEGKCNLQQVDYISRMFSSTARFQDSTGAVISIHLAATRGTDADCVKCSLFIDWLYETPG